MEKERQSSSLQHVTGEDLFAREKAAADRAAKSSAVSASACQPKSQAERNKAAEAAIQQQKQQSEALHNNLREFKDSALDALTNACHKAVSFDEATLRALLRNAYEAGHKAGFKSGVHFAIHHHA